MLNLNTRSAQSDEHALFRTTVQKLLAKELDPNLARWEQDGCIDRAFWLACGETGMLCPTVPEPYGGLGLDFTYNAIVNEELGYRGLGGGISVQSDIVAEYIVKIGSESQKLDILPKLVSGEWVSSIAMTEPGAGSDLQGIRTRAQRDGDHFVISGSKTYITNGHSADIIIVVAKTDPLQSGKGISLFIVEAGRQGFRPGRMLDKIGQWSSDTSELFFDEVRVPESNLLGSENAGFGYMMDLLAQERLALATSAQGLAQRAFDEAVTFTKGRQAFGKSVFDFQNTRFTLADLKSKLQVGWAHLDWAVAKHVQGNLSAAEASAAKYWHTETLWLVVDAALQMHGGAGYMNEMTVARLWRDARVQRIYGGTSEIMREIIGRAL